MGFQSKVAIYLREQDILLTFFFCDLYEDYTDLPDLVNDSSSEIIWIPTTVLIAVQIHAC